MYVEEPIPAYARRHWTIPEYLNMESGSNVKHEYYRGEVFAMSGALLPHVIVTDNVMFALRQRLNGSGCKPYNSDLRIHVEENTLFTYPDISIFCGDVKTLNDDQYNAVNPIVIMEVVSKSTAAYDRGDKFNLYKSIPSLKEYILIDSLSVLVESFQCNREEKWEGRTFNSIDSILHLPNLNVNLPLKEIYSETKMAIALI